MKGLLIKDLFLLRNQRRILPVYLILAVWFTAMHNDGFAFPFLMMMASVLTVSTISYDELDHGQAYLFTLPVSRKTYVREKFVLGGILAASSLLLAMSCSAVRLLIRPDIPAAELGQITALSACAGMAFIAVMIPIRIRFGGDQGRIVMYMFFGLVALAVVLISKVFPGSGEQMGAFLMHLSIPVILLAAAGAAFILVAVGYLLSVYWMERKEF